VLVVCYARLRSTSRSRAGRGRRSWSRPRCRGSSAHGWRAWGRGQAQLRYAKGARYDAPRSGSGGEYRQRVGRMHTRTVLKPTRTLVRVDLPTPSPLPGHRLCPPTCPSDANGCYHRRCSSGCPRSTASSCTSWAPRAAPAFRVRRRPWIRCRPRPGLLRGRSAATVEGAAPVAAPEPRWRAAALGR
jgi:hypothetical protein